MSDSMWYSFPPATRRCGNDPPIPQKETLKGSLLQELKRRSVFRAVAVYTFVAWLLVQIADIILPTFSGPVWVNQAIIIVLLLGFPVVLILAWIFELVPKGITITEDSAADQIVIPTSSGFNAVTIGLMTIAVMFLFVDRYFLNADDPIIAAPSFLSKTFVNLEQLEKRPQGGYSSFDFTPDGRKIVYSSFSDGIYRLHTRELTELDSKTILENEEGVFLPKVSPDSKRILYWSESQLFTIPIEGGASQQVVAAVAPNSHAWLSPTSVVYTENPDFSLHVVNINGEELRTFDHRLIRNGIYIDPEPLPDGKSVLYSVSMRDGEWQIHLLDLLTGMSMPIIRDAYEAQYMSSGHIGFIRGDFLWAAPFDLATRTITGAESPIVEGIQNVYNYGAAAYAVSTQGQLIYLGGTSELVDASYLVWVDSDGTQEVIDLPPRDYREITISPTGTRLALTITQPEGSSDIWIYDFELGMLNRATATGGAMNPVWTPDGKRIVFNDILGDLGLWMTNADGSGTPQLLTGEDILTGPGTFSPDGKQLIYIQGSHPDWNMKILNVAEDQLIRQDLLTTRFEERQPAISPDGRWLAYMSDETGDAEIYVRSFPNINDSKWRISLNGGVEPLWSENGSFLYFIGRIGDVKKIVRVSVTADPEFIIGEIQPVLELPKVFTNEPSYAISPIDQRILTLQPSEKIIDEATDHPSQAIFVDNWSEEVNRLAPPGFGSSE